MAWPDRTLQANRFGVSIPKLGSWLMTGGAEAWAARLNALLRADQPPSFLVFYPFHASVRLGLLMIGLGLCGLCWGPRGVPGRSCFCLLAATAMRPPGFVRLSAAGS